MDKPLLLDLFCGAGGAAEGYHRAGFVCVGVDLDPKPLRHYPFEAWQDDALVVLDRLLAGERWHGYRLADFDAIHASPPCQANSASRHMVGARRWKTTPDLVTPMYQRLRTTHLAWVIENVAGAPMPDNVMLCGSMFGLPMRRHRLFASSHLLFAPRPCRHATTDYLVEVVGGKIRGIGAYRNPVAFITPGGYSQRREAALTKADGQRAMDVDWMTIPEMCEAIPPAYTHWLGAQLLNAIPERTRKVS